MTKKKFEVYGLTQEGYRVQHIIHSESHVWAEEKYKRAQPGAMILAIAMSAGNALPICVTGDKMSIPALKRDEADRRRRAAKAKAQEVAAE